MKIFWFTYFVQRKYFDSNDKNIEYIIGHKMERNVLNL